MWGTCVFVLLEWQQYSQGEQGGGGGRGLGGAERM